MLHSGTGPSQCAAEEEVLDHGEFPQDLHENGFKDVSEDLGSPHLHHASHRPVPVRN